MSGKNHLYYVYDMVAEEHYLLAYQLLNGNMTATLTLICGRDDYAIAPLLAGAMSVTAERREFTAEGHYLCVVTPIEPELTERHVLGSEAFLGVAAGLELQLVYLSFFDLTKAEAEEQLALMDFPDSTAILLPEEMANDMLALLLANQS